jgi:DNA-binding transcriptional ArsR family regulator
MIADEVLNRLAEIFQSLSDPTRLKIIVFLSDGESNVTNIADAIDMSTSATSHQLGYLKARKLVKSRRDGKNILYSLDDEHVMMLFKQGLEHAQESI